MDTEHKPITYSVVPAGTVKYPRFRIANQYGQYWDGEDWVGEEHRGLAYANSNDACLEVQRLLMGEYNQLPVKKYCAPVMIDLFSNHEIPIEDLKQWLLKVSKLILNNDDHGNGPVNGSLGCISIDWGQLEEVK